MDRVRLPIIVLKKIRSVKQDGFSSENCFKRITRMDRKKTG
jgi:hypothetical protein